ncbi:hypothetical protein [Natronospora cellulosivora (SeqCode)]
MNIDIVNLQEIINFVRANGLLFSLFVCFVLLTLVFKIVMILVLNFSLMKMEKSIQENLDENIFFKNLLESYQEQLKVQYNLVNTKSFLNNYFLQNKRKHIFFIELIERSDYFYILIGLLVSFILSLSAIISLNLEDLNGFDDFFIRIQDMLYVLRPVLFFLILGIIAAIIVNIFIRVFNLRKRIENIKTKLEDYLENKVKHKYNYKLKQLKLFEQLIETIDTGFVRLEDLLEEKEDITNNDNGNNVYKENQEKIVKEIAATNEKNVIDKNETKKD